MSRAVGRICLWALFLAAAGASGGRRLGNGIRRRYQPGAAETSMPNLQQLEQLEAFWDLPGHKKPALLIQELIVEYEPFLSRIRPQVAALVRTFRAAGLPIFWSTWWRLSPQLLRRMGLPEHWSRNHTNELDRLFGPLGIPEGENGNFLYQDQGWEILSEIAPATEEERRRVQLKWRMDCFAESEWAVPAGQRDLASEMRGLGVDLVVNTGVWTDACIVATAFGAMNKDLDLVTVSDAVDTVTTGQQAALYTIQGAAGKICDTATVLEYVNAEILGGEAPRGNLSIGRLAGGTAIRLEAYSPPPQAVSSPPYGVLFFISWTLLCLLASHMYGSSRWHVTGKRAEQPLLQV